MVEYPNGATGVFVTSTGDAGGTNRLEISGELGKPLAFRTSFAHPGPECWTDQPNSWFIHKSQSAFGVLADLGIHKTDLIHFLLDDPITSVSAVMTTLDLAF